MWRFPGSIFCPGICSCCGALFTLYVLIAGGVDTGWTFYTPLSTSYATGHVAAAAAGVFVAGFSTIATGVNFVATIHMLRAPGMTWFRLPLFVWSMYAVSLVMLLATPVLAMTLLLIFAERVFGMPVFDPAQGGDPLLFQHLFWFYSHPAVYIMILPAMGVVSEIFTCFARRRIFGYTFMVYALLAIAVIGFMVWGHHMFVAGQSALADLVFSFLSFIVAVPSAIKVFNWTATLYRGQISFEAPMLYAMGFLALFTLGGLTGLHLASVPLDIHLHDTYFVIAHFHFIMVGGTVSAFLGGIHYWWPKIHRPHVSGVLGALRCDHHVDWFHHHVPAAVRHGLCRNAAPVSDLSAAIPDLSRHLVGRRHDPRRRLHHAAALSRLVAALWPARRQQPVGRDGARMANVLAAAQGELPRHTAGRGRTLRVPRSPKLDRAATAPRRVRKVRTDERQRDDPARALAERRAPALWRRVRHLDFSRHRNVVLRRACFSTTRSIAACTPRHSASPRMRPTSSMARRTR